jgi:hypothetical protein
MSSWQDLHFHDLCELFELILTDIGGEFKDPVLSGIPPFFWGELSTRITFATQMCLERLSSKETTAFSTSVIPKEPRLDIIPGGFTLLTNPFQTVFRGYS